MPLRVTKNQLESGRPAERVPHETLKKERHIPSLKALEQAGGPEFDFFIEVPKREVWGAQLILEDW
jgi:hypothetical protein